jgi:hypothetical protein
VAGGEEWWNELGQALITTGEYKKRVCSFQRTAVAIAEEVKYTAVFVLTG